LCVAPPNDVARRELNFFYRTKAKEGGPKKQKNNQNKKHNRDDQSKKKGRRKSVFTDLELHVLKEKPLN
jgi:hypothetical protein